MAFTPSPTSEILVPTDPLRTSSAVGSYLVPNLSLSLITSILLRLPCFPLIFKNTKPSFPVFDSNSFSSFGNLASAKVISESTADVNHLYPYNWHFFPSWSSMATVSVPD